MVGFLGTIGKGFGVFSLPARTSLQHPQSQTSKGKSNCCWLSMVNNKSSGANHNPSIHLFKLSLMVGWSALWKAKGMKQTFLDTSGGAGNCHAPTPLYILLELFSSLLRILGVGGCWDWPCCWLPLLAFPQLVIQFPLHRVRQDCNREDEKKRRGGRGRGEERRGRNLPSKASCSLVKASWLPPLSGWYSFKGVSG